MVLMRSGRRVCGKQCHRAKGDSCSCLCQGKYHGSETKKKQLKLFDETDLQKVAK
jgi:hypothetical protein